MARLVAILENGKHVS